MNISCSCDFIYCNVTFYLIIVTLFLINVPLYLIVWLLSCNCDLFTHNFDFTYIVYCISGAFLSHNRDFMTVYNCDYISQCDFLSHNCSFIYQKLDFMSQCDFFIVIVTMSHNCYTVSYKVTCFIIVTVILENVTLYIIIWFWWNVTLFLATVFWLYCLFLFFFLTTVSLSYNMTFFI